MTLCTYFHRAFLEENSFADLQSARLAATHGANKTVTLPSFWIISANGSWAGMIRGN
jgi:hypothetical protein